VNFTIDSCSSEDEVHPSSNLLNYDLYRTWQTDGPQKKASVELVLEKPTKIECIELANAGTAMVEILVAKNSDPKDYKVLVPVTMLTTLSDQKEGNNRSAIREFKSAKFTSSGALVKWDRIRIVCSTPWHPNPIGLSYIKINPKQKKKEEEGKDKPEAKKGEEEQNRSQQTPPLKSSQEEVKKTPSFSKNSQENKKEMEKDNKKEKDIENSQGTLNKTSSFSKNSQDGKKETETDNNSGSLKKTSSVLNNQVKETSEKSHKQTEKAGNSQESLKKTLISNKQENKGKDNEDEDKEKDSSQEKLKRIPSITKKKEKEDKGTDNSTENLKKISLVPSKQGKEESKGEAKDKQTKKPPKQNQDDEGEEENNKLKSTQESKKSSQKSSKEDDMELVVEAQKGKQKNPPLNKILEGTIFCISGIENPERKEIRDMGVSLGADYKQNWDGSCTHLICEYANTPKYVEVKKKGGIIVRPKWLHDCYSKKQRLPLSAAYMFQEDKPHLSDDSGKAKKSQSKNQSKTKSPKKNAPKGYKSDTDDDDDGQPNRYDLTDSFIDNSEMKSASEEEAEAEEEKEHSDDDEDEDMEAVKEAKAFLKRGNGNPKRRHPDYKHKAEEDVQKEKTPKKNNHKSVKKENKSAEDSGTEEMADIDFAVKYSPPSTKKQKVTTATPPKPKTTTTATTTTTTKPKATTDRSENLHKSSVQAKKPESSNPKKSEKYESDGDSDSTQPVDKEELKGMMAEFEQDVESFLKKGSINNDSTQEIKTDLDASENQKAPNKKGEKNQKNEKLGKDYPLDKLPEFMSEARVFFSGLSTNKDKERSLRRYVVAYNGTIDDYLGDETRYIITDKKWDKTFDLALKDHPELCFVRPDWILECHDSQKWVNPKKHLVLKNSK